MINEYLYIIRARFSNIGITRDKICSSRLIENDDSSSEDDESHGSQEIS